MEKIITYETLRSFAYSNDRLIRGPIRGVVLSFFGLGGAQMFSDDPEEGVYFAGKNILYVVPYTDPWAWMNRQEVGYTDEILDILFAKYGLKDTVPIVSSGGSMGGLACLVYAGYAKRTPVSCVANCPVCDLVYHYQERPDLPRTLYSAFWNYEGDLNTALQSASPLHMVKTLPKIPYHLFHCDQDQAVNMEVHSVRFVTAMREAGHDITLDIVPGRGHCDLTDEMRARFREYCVSAVETAAAAKNGSEAPAAEKEGSEAAAAEKETAKTPATEKETAKTAAAEKEAAETAASAKG